NACISSLVLMIFRPPTSTLFPTRRSSDLLHDGREPEQQHSQARLLFRKGKLCIPGEISVQRRASRRRKQPLWEEQPIWRVSRRIRRLEHFQRVVLAYQRRRQLCETTCWVRCNR